MPESDLDQRHPYWQLWAQYLHRLGLRGFAASLLEALGPLTILGAQAVYIGEPVLGSFLPQEQLQALASLLESTEETDIFVTYLRETE